jgi:hypothetical protein
MQVAAPEAADICYSPSMVATIALAFILKSPPQNDQAQIKALCDQIAVATQTKNWAKLRTLCTPDFKQKTTEGKTLTLNQLIAGFNEGMKGMQNPKLTYKILSFNSKGTTATAEIYWNMAATMLLQGKNHKVESADSEADTFKKVKGHWLESSVTEHKTSVKVDGKPFNTGLSA